MSYAGYPTKEDWAESHNECGEKFHEILAIENPSAEIDTTKRKGFIRYEAKCKKHNATIWAYVKLPEAP